MQTQNSACTSTAQRRTSRSPGVVGGESESKHSVLRLYPSSLLAELETKYERHAMLSTLCARCHWTSVGTATSDPPAKACKRLACTKSIAEHPTTKHDQGSGWCSATQVRNTPGTCQRKWLALWVATLAPAPHDRRTNVCSRLQW